MATPQTPDSIRKSQEDKTPPPPSDDDDRKLSNDDVQDNAKERQGGL